MTMPSTYTRSNGTDGGSIAFHNLASCGIDSIELMAGIAKGSRRPARRAGDEPARLAPRQALYLDDPSQNVVKEKGARIDIVGLGG